MVTVLVAKGALVEGVSVGESTVEVEVATDTVVITSFCREFPLTATRGERKKHKLNKRQGARRGRSARSGNSLPDAAENNCRILDID